MSNFWELAIGSFFMYDQLINYIMFESIVKIEM